MDPVLWWLGFVGIITLPGSLTAVHKNTQKAHFFREDPKQFKQIQIETCDSVKYLFEGLDELFFSPSAHFFSLTDHNIKQGSLFDTNPKKCTISVEIPQNEHIFILFHPPKKLGNLMMPFC